jgi:hypothetical protein
MLASQPRLLLRSPEMIEASDLGFALQHGEELWPPGHTEERPKVLMRVPEIGRDHVEVAVDWSVRFGRSEPWLPSS